MTTLLIGAVLAVAAGAMARGIMRGNPAIIVDGLWILCLGVGIIFAEWASIHGKYGVAVGAFLGMATVAALLFGVRMVIFQEHRRTLRDREEGEAPSKFAGPSGGWLSGVTRLVWREPRFRARAATRLDTRYLRMAFDQSDGSLSGTVRRGHLRGKPLESLSFYQLMDLRDLCLRGDPRSVAVLETWLDRSVEGWRVRAGLEIPQAERAAFGNGSGEMSTEEARLVLGVAADATLDAIKDAHRRLMQRLHPDLGGSTYLAAKVNEARDRLIEG